MSVIRRPFVAWVRYCRAEMDPRPLAWVRVLVALCVLCDLLRLGQLGLVNTLFRGYADGGLSRIQAQNWVWVTEASTLWGGPVAWFVCVVCAIAVVLGVRARLAMIVLLVFYAQLGHLYPPGDRGIDRMIRTVLLVLVFSGSHRALCIRGGPRPSRIPAWPAQLIIFLLVMMYMTAGLHKLGSNPQWLALSGDSPIYRIVTDPMAGRLDPMTTRAWLPLWRVLGCLTIIFEVGAFLLLSRWSRWWAILGIGMHLGLAFTMHLGMFSWAMLAFYPIMMESWTCRASDWLGIQLKSWRQRFR